MDEWSGQWIVGVISLQKTYGLCGLKQHIVNRQQTTTREDKATQFVICETLSLKMTNPWCTTNIIGLYISNKCKYIYDALREWVINSKTLCWEGIFHCSSRYDWLPWIQLRWFSKPKLHLLSMPYSELKSILQNWFHLSISIVCPPSILNKVWKKRETRMRGKFCVELVFVWSAPVLQLLS